MSEELNVSGQEEAIDNGEVQAENSEVNKDTASKDTNADIKTGQAEDFDTNSENEDKDEISLSENEEQSENEDEVFISFDDGGKIMRSQAEDYAKKGYEFEQKYNPVINKLNMLASNALKADGSEYDGIEDFVEALSVFSDNALKDECLSDAGGDEQLAKEIFESRKRIRDERYNDILEKRQQESKTMLENETDRVANEFLELQKEFPEITAYNSLPKEVKDYAARNKCSLLTAKLLIDRKNQKAAEKVKADAASAAKKSVGSQSGAAGAQFSREIMAMLRGMRR